MATSGSVDSGGYQGRVLRFEWGTNSTNPSDNTRNIWYKITAVGGSSSVYYHHNETIEINGTNVYTGSDSHAVTTNDVLASGNMTINQSSTLTLVVKMHGGIYNRTDNINTEKSWSLDEIPRYANLTSLSVKSKTINSVTLQYTTDKSANLFARFTSGGDSTEWLNFGSPFVTNTTSGTFTIYYRNRENSNRLVPNTSYNIEVLCRSAVSGLDTAKSISVTTYDIAKLVSVPNVNIGDSQALTWTNPSGATTTLKLCKTDNTQIISYGTVTGTSKTVTPTASTIYTLTPNSNTYTARYIITTTANSTSYTNYKDFTFNVKNSNPTFTTYTYADVNSTTTALTGNNQILVKGYSNNKVTITTANKAVAKNSATMKSYKLVQSSSTGSITANYSDSASVTLQVNKITSNTMTVSATDSRGNSTSVAKTLSSSNYKEYADVTIKSVTGTRSNNGVGQAVTLAYNGTFWNANFGSVTNAITVKYQYKETSSSTWSSATTLTPTISGNNYSGSVSIQGNLGANGFSVEKSFNIRLTVTDKLVTKTYDYTLGAGTPAIAIYKDKVAIGQKYNTSMGGKMQVNGDIVIYPKTSNWISGKTISNAGIRINRALSTGNIYDAFIAGKDKDGRTWNFGGITNNIGIYVFDSSQTANSYNRALIYNLSDGSLSASKFKMGDTDILLKVYPVGALYISTNSTSPASLFGGTWARMKGGFLYGATSDSASNSSYTGTSTQGPSNNTSGSTTLTVNQIPAHKHYTTSNATSTDGSGVTTQSIAIGGNDYWLCHTGNANIFPTNSIGGGQGHTHTLSSHTHAIPYMSVIIWKRTA